MKKMLLLSLLLISMSGVYANMKVDTLFTNQPIISVDEAKIMKKEILIYLQSNPDSIHTGIYFKLDSLSKFILNPKLGQSVIPDIPVVIANQIENTYFGRDILKWKPRDEQYQIDSQQMMIDDYTRRNNEAKALLAVKISYRKKFLLLIGQNPN